MTSHKTKATRCPQCRHILECATNVDEDRNQPEPGDISICFTCGAILRFREDLRVTECTKSELAEIAKDQPETFLKMLTIQAVLKKKRLTDIQNVKSN